MVFLLYKCRNIVTNMRSSRSEALLLEDPNNRRKRRESEVEMQLLRRARVEDGGIYDDGIKYMLEDTAKTVLCVFVCSFECGRVRWYI